MSSSLVTANHTALFAVATGYPKPPGAWVEPFENLGVDGMGYHVHGSRAPEFQLDTMADLVTASDVAIETARYGQMKGKLATLTVGLLGSWTVMILDVEPDVGPCGASAGPSALNPGTAQYLLTAKWKLQYPYGA